MKTNDIKKRWESGIRNNIKTYSETELNNFIVISARKSIKAISPGIAFRIIIIAIIIFIIVRLIITDRGPEIMITDLSALVILSVSYFLWERTTYKMNRYTPDIPVKQWLDERIKKIEKSMQINTKYDIAIYSGSFLVAIIFYVAYQIFTQVKPNIVTVIGIPAGLVIYFLVIRHLHNRNYKKTLDNLKELYSQFEE